MSTDAPKDAAPKHKKKGLKITLLSIFAVIVIFVGHDVYRMVAAEGTGLWAWKIAGIFMHEPDKEYLPKEVVDAVLKGDLKAVEKLVPEVTESTDEKEKDKEGEKHTYTTALGPTKYLTEVQDKDGKTLLIHAVLAKQTALFDTLCGATRVGASVEIFDGEGKSALHHAIEIGDPTFVEAFFNSCLPEKPCKTSPQAKTDANMGPVQLARSLKKDDVAEWLKTNAYPDQPEEGVECQAAKAAQDEAAAVKAEGEKK